MKLKQTSGDYPNPLHVDGNGERQFQAAFADHLSAEYSPKRFSTYALTFATLLQSSSIID